MARLRIFLPLVIVMLIIVMFRGYYSQGLTDVLQKMVSSSMSYSTINSLREHYTSSDVSDKASLAVSDIPDVQHKPADFSDAEHAPADIPENVKLVLIIAYMRSGSTLTGELFNANDNVFYLFEPLWIPAHIIVPGGQPYFHKGIIRSPLSLDRTDDYYRDVLRSIFQCNLSDLDTRISSHGFMDTSNAMKGIERDDIARKSESCNSKEIRVVKEIHIRLNSTWDLLKQYSNLHVVHLMRDPRAVMESRYELSEYYKAGPYMTTLEVCGAMIRDLAAFVALKEHFPTRVHRVYYESMALDTKKNAEELYNTLNLHVPLEMKRWIDSNMNTGETADDKAGYGTKRSNSTRTISKWRTRIDWKLVSDVQSHCKPVFEKTHYKMMETLTQIRNLTIPLY